jgi:hypothetical protein
MYAITNLLFRELQNRVRRFSGIMRYLWDLVSFPLHRISSFSSEISDFRFGALAEWLRRLTRIILTFWYQILSGARVRISWASTSFFVRLVLMGEIFLVRDGLEGDESGRV